MERLELLSRVVMTGTDSDPLPGRLLIARGEAGVDASVRYTLGEIHSTRIRAFDRWQTRPRSRAAQRPWTESISARNSTDSPGNAVHLIALSLQRVEDGAKSAQSVERAGADVCASNQVDPLSCRRSAPEGARLLRGMRFSRAAMSGKQTRHRAER